MLRKLRTTGDVLIGRVPRGADISKTIEQVCAEYNISAAWVQAIGAVSKATVAYYTQDTHVYNTRQLDGGFEIVSCTGNITIKDGKQFAHLHIVLSDAQYACTAGHLMPGTTEVFACEYSITALEGDPLVRKPDESTGLALWSDCDV
jgi:predicted DNA-binding protein with PD1-like motif